MSLENHVTKDTPPCFLWQTVTDQTVPVENSYLFAQACAQAGVPFAQHVFSEGIHGLSVATEEWLEQNIGQEEGKRYTQEQVQMLAEAIEAGETPFPKEKGEELLVKFGKAGKMDGKAERGNPQNAERSTELDAACRSVDGEISESGIEENIYVYRIGKDEKFRKYTDKSG